MGKSRIEEYVPRAYKAIKSEHTGIATRIVIGDVEDYEVIEGLKGQIASFGSAINMGNLKSAVAFFSAKGGAQTERQDLMKAIYLIINKDINIDGDNINCTNRSLFDQIVNVNDEDKISEFKEKILDAAVAVKLAIRMCKNVKKKSSSEGAQNG